MIRVRQLKEKARMRQRFHDDGIVAALDNDDDGKSLPDNESFNCTCIGAPS